jgi:type IV pilus assembly protein PilY1
MSTNWFANGDKVNITFSGTAGNDSAYVVSDAVIDCGSDSTCQSFTYAITATPAVSAIAMGTVSPSGGSATIAAGNITRTGTDLRTAKVVGVEANMFTNGASVEISPSGSSLSSESAYVGTWTIDCGSDTTCSTFTFGPVTLYPSTPATGLNIQAYSGTTSPDKDSLIKWLRGEDNAGDEKGPGNGITVRPSVHGDVLHSRPLVINYGDTRRGIVVYYGSNDGVYRAVNGNQKDSITSGSITVPAGGELWGLILPEHYQLINRYRSNSPEVKFPGTFLSTAQPKDYFVDGPTGVYQKLNEDGTIAKAIIYLTMRRGGRFMYALDVTEPMAPKRVWSISQQSTDFEELGQTWSRPRLTLLQNYKDASGIPIPVLVFGAGYDTAQDAEPPTADTMGRGIFVVNALDGTKVFSASVSCADAVTNCRKVSNMKYATPSDITFVDRDADGFTDKFYWGDTGGNVWRADVAAASVADWTVNRLAKLGCSSGECSSGTTPRKFFFPPAVLSVRPAGDAASYEMVSLVSGDREHPLQDTTNTYSAYNVNDRFFMIKDLGTTVNSTTLNTVDVTASDTDLFNATYTLWDGTKKGFYINFIGAAWSDTTNQPDSSKTPTKGEKAVNAPVAVNGQIFFSTNQPKDKDNTCKANLGTARAYAISPFTGKQIQNELDGGGLPPSAVSGLITITETNSDGSTTSTQEKFCIGCGVSGSQTGGTNTAPCTSALENCNIGTVIPKNLKRTYWYKK